MNVLIESPVIVATFATFSVVFVLAFAKLWQEIKDWKRK